RGISASSRRLSSGRASSPCCRTSRATSPDVTAGRPATEGRWRLLLGTVAFVVWAPPSLLGLPLVGLLLATRPRTTVEWGTASGVGMLSAGLTLAWQWHRRVARNPLGPPPAPFREFRFGDHWVWAIIAALVGWITPAVAGLKLAALNVLVVLGGLYLVRGIAIVVACAAAF